MLALLWSINERMAGRDGIDAEAPGMDWLDDLWSLWVEERRERRKAESDDA